MMDNCKGNENLLESECTMGRDETESTLRWVKEQYSYALDKFSRISPVTTLNGLMQGDVMVSLSGNARLLLKVDQKTSFTIVTFLSRLRSGKVALESTQLHKVDASKLEAIIRRKAGNPLERFSDVAENLEAERNILHNTRILLQSGNAGAQFRSAIQQLKKHEQAFVDVDLWVSIDTGEILQIGGGEPDAPTRLISLTVNCLASPSEDYIKSARFDRESEQVVKRSILGAAVIANTLENARNVSIFAHKAQA